MVVERATLGGRGTRTLRPVLDAVVEQARRGTEQAGYSPVTCCLFVISALKAMCFARSVAWEPHVSLLSDPIRTLVSRSRPELLSGTEDAITSCWMSLEDEWLLDSDLAGRASQIFRLQQKERCKEQKTIDANPEEQVILTQVSTPWWMVRYLTDHTLKEVLRERMMHGDWGAGAGQRRSLVGESRTIKKAPAIPMVLDPACGSGRFLQYAMDLMIGFYLYKGPWPAHRTVAECLKQLHGLEIDPLAVSVCRSQLLMKAQSTYGAEASHEIITSLNSNIVEPCRKDPPSPELKDQILQAGSLVTPEIATRLGIDRNTFGSPVEGKTYDVVLMNPPYLDKREYSPALAAFLKTYYPKSKANLYGAFLERMLTFCRDGGRWGAITPQSWLFIKSFRHLRDLFLEEASLDSLIHLGIGVFDEVVDTAAITGSRRSGVDWNLVCIDLFDARNKEEALAREITSPSQRTVTIRRDEIRNLPDRALLYGIPSEVRRLFGTLPSLADFADVALGMKTSDNARFLRYWWEVRQPGRKLPPSLGPVEPQDQLWLPYDKQTSGFPFYRGARFVVDWSPAAVNYYGTHYSAQLPNKRLWRAEGITFGMLSSRGFAAKYLPAGHMTDMASNLVIPHRKEELWYILGFLNSRLAGYLLRNLNPSVNFQVRDVSRLPFQLPDEKTRRFISLMTRLVVQMERLRDSCDETSPDFSGSVLGRVTGHSLLDRIETSTALWGAAETSMTWLVAALERQFHRVYGISEESVQVIERCDAAGVDALLKNWPGFGCGSDLVHSLVSYAVGVLLGRWSEANGDAKGPTRRAMIGLKPGLVQSSGRHVTIAQIRNWLCSAVGPDAACEAERRLQKSLDDYVKKDFLPAHSRQYGHKPIFVGSEDESLGFILSLKEQGGDEGSD